jgi:hypothetical protein
MKKQTLLTKEDIARELSENEPLSIRSVERYINLARVVPAVKGSGRGKQAKFRREDVDKVVAAYKAAAEKRENKSTTAITTTKPAALSPVAVITELMSNNLVVVQSLTQSLAESLDSCPIWLTREQALERTGLPRTWLDAAIASKELQHVGDGRGRRYHRADVRAFAGRVQDRNFLSSILNRSKKKKARR